MRRFLVMALVALTIPIASPAAAATPRRTVCTVTDHRVIGLSGLIVTDSGFVSISDSNIDKSAIRVWFFDKKCRVTRSISYPTSAYDPEDMALGRDGTIYVADIGDNTGERKSVAVWRIPAGSSTPHLFRYRYPDRAHDAEAMLLAADDTPIFITKDFGAGEIFVPTAPADPSGKPVKLKRAGTFTPEVTGTSNPFGLLGAAVVTGGANSRDRSRVALRTYADAYVWDVTGGNVVKTITTTTPQVIALPDESQGESIAFDPGGMHLYTVSDREVTPVKTPILEYALPAGAALHAPAPSASPAPVADPSHRAGTPTALLVALAALLILIGTVVVVVVVRAASRSTRQTGR